MDQQSTSALIVTLAAIFLFGGGIVFFCFKMFKMTSQAKKKQKSELSMKREETGATHIVSFKHMTGLPVSEGALCRLMLCPDKIIIESGGATFNLDKAKITDACVKTDVEIQKQYVSSAGGAVAGAVLFGPLGAIVGGRTKKKENKTVSSYFIYTYTKNGSVEYISFDVTHQQHQVIPFITDFKQSAPAQTVVDL